MTKTKPNEPGAGCLYVVATPIGNLEDISLRALRVLKESDAIACEDTRQTLKLLSHFDIQKRMVSYHEHNEMTRAAEIVIELEQGAQIALVTDAGTPGISDPGGRLVSLALRHGIQVVPLPGACAFVAALAASGMSTEEFTFIGFLPSRPTETTQTFADACRRTAHFGAVRGAAPPARHAGRRAGDSGQSPGGGGARIDQSVRGVRARPSGRLARRSAHETTARGNHSADWPRGWGGPTHRGR